MFKVIKSLKAHEELLQCVDLNIDFKQKDKTNRVELELSVQTFVFLSNPLLQCALHRSLSDGGVTSSSVSNH